MISIQQLGIEMPSDIFAEQAVIGAILLDTQAIDIVRETLRGGEFFDAGLGRIYRAMTDVQDKGNPVDLVTLVARLQDSKELEAVGGVAYLTNLTNSVPTATNVSYYVDLVYEKFMQRQNILAGYDMFVKAVHSDDAKSFIASASDSVSNLSEQAVTKRDFVPISQVLVNVWEKSEQLYNNRSNNRGVTGIPSGYTDLDRLTAGFQGEDLIIVAARPSVGKTAFALNIAQNVGIRAKETVAVFSLEMSASQLVMRMISAEGHVDASRLRTGFFENDDFERMSEAIGNLSSADIHIDDSPGLTVMEIRAKCRRLKKEKGLGLVLIDYLQLINSVQRNGVNRQQEVSEISRTLKHLARELGVPVIALSQLSRGVEQRQDKRPMMSDLRESGSIEQDADIVAFLYRDDYYDKESEKKNIIEIIIAKQRNGPVGTVELAFMKQFNKFVSLDRSHHDDQPALPAAENNGKRIPDMHRRSS